MAQESQNSRAAARRSAAQVFAALISLSDDAITTKTLDGVLTSWNHGAARIYGYTSDEAVGQPMTMLCPPDRKGEIADILAKVSAGERVYHYETMRQRKDGTVFPVSVSVSPLHDEYGTMIGAASIARDITEQRQLRVAAAQAKRRADLVTANQNLTSFAYAVSHDLRGPLRALSGYSDALVEEYADVLGEHGRSYAQRISSAAGHMSAVIDALLQLSRLARAEVHLQRVDISAEAEQISVDLQRQEPDRNVRFDIERSIQGRGDRELVRTILSELIRNAWKFTAQGGDQVIQVGKIPTGGSSTCCFVRDNGAGFEAAYADKLFKPFQRLHDPEEFPGIGVGLAAVQQLVQLHGGRAWAEGAVAGGATFYFTLDPTEPDSLTGPTGLAGAAPSAPDETGRSHGTAVA